MSSAALPSCGPLPPHVLRTAPHETAPVVAAPVLSWQAAVWAAPLGSDAAGWLPGSATAPGTPAWDLQQHTAAQIVQGPATSLAGTSEGRQLSSQPVEGTQAESCLFCRSC